MAFNTGSAELRIYNTLTRQKALFTPIEPGKIRMYVCGMTVYDYCHLGHARVLVAFDVITRYLRALGYDVHYVRNITDVDDKIINRAAENGESCDQLTERFIEAMHEDEARLGVLSPTEEPRATAHMGQIIAMIETLIEKGYAYAADNGDVYYRVERFEGYGKLNNRNLEEMQAGSRIEVSDVKENPYDFVLWKSAKAGEVSWNSPWGAGRPGWHIECSAMSKCCLGDTFDIHGGGPDLKFPHHENEIAQSEAANGVPFVNTWMHAGAIRVNKEKMSKSLGNFFTIREILDTYDPEVVRYFLTQGHYRSQIDYSEASLKEVRGIVDSFYHALRGLPAGEEGELENDVEARFFEAMSDDFNTALALSVLHELVREINRVKEADIGQAARLGAQLRRLGNVLGLFQRDPEQYLQGGASAQGPSAEEIERCIQERAAAKRARDFATADRIRDELKAQGVILDDSREGTSWRREA
ncbi:cysteine--tRNA ligase [Aestuariirhabdus litorea]|uniref:Cysteine--tRNA ligase n=1 Tax=Aestuariirhabdus litorea TaxID=2528527 RepID=A0A3P3VRH2_9GAMM|nr:cysteine--tRNA ligase [Aestuariirhabdus litorea]RRJ84907.1 cysteine--tRNA ligase [Aestuariirhabdus litorea]RWW98133.1 cysteine--tRNA ligase [Endozoicomonadaceae bacterium GTF-13]